MSAAPSSTAAVRALQLYGLELKSWLHRLHHDLARELSALVASLVLLATFGYVFNDFLNVEVAALSPAMRLVLARCATVAIAAAAITAAGRAIARARTFGPGLSATARQLGEDEAAIARYARARDITIIIALHGAALALVVQLLKPWSTFHCLLLFILAAGVSALLGPRLVAWEKARATRLAQSAAKALMPWTKPSSTPAQAAAAWRAAQIRRRPWTAGLLLKAAFACAALAGAAAAFAMPDLIPIALGYLSGALIAAVLVAQLAEDLRSAWAERSLGLSHDDIVKAYLYLAATFALRSALVALASILLCYLGLFATKGGALLAPQALAQFAGKVAAVILVTPLATPFLMFQIDGRRMAINIVVISVVGLFLATGLYAHWAAALIPLILCSAAAGNQQGRYHRA